MYANDKCTIWLHALDYMPVVVPRCFFSETSESIESTNGVQIQKTAKVIFKYPKSIPFSESKDFVLAGDKSALKIAKPLFLGPDTFLGGNTFMWTIEDRANAFREIRSAGAFTIMSAVYKDFGRPQMRHWELVCR